VAGYCKHGVELSGSIKDNECIHWLSENPFSFLKELSSMELRMLVFPEGAVKM
jgi:hypothetical protein